MWGKCGVWMKINAPTSGALTHASSLYISLRVQKLTKSYVQPNVAGGACFFDEKRVSGVSFDLWWRRARRTWAVGIRLRTVRGCRTEVRVSEAEVPNGGGRVWLRGISSSAAECQRAFTLGGISPCSASVGESRCAVKLDRKSCSLPWGKSVTLFLGSREAAFESCREFKVGRTAIKRRQ